MKTIKTRKMIKKMRIKTKDKTNNRRKMTNKKRI